MVIGWETSPNEWARALAEALRTPSVVQERVTIAYEAYPTMVDGAVQMVAAWWTATHLCLVARFMGVCVVFRR